MDASNRHAEEHHCDPLRARHSSEVKGARPKRDLTIFVDPAAWPKSDKYRYSAMKIIARMYRCAGRVPFQNCMV